MRPAHLDHFYSEIPIRDWQQILGLDLHYHNGYFKGAESLAEGQQQAVRNFYEYIPPGASILDAGCGWGGPARMLVNEKNASLHGLTISRAQAEYCAELGLEISCLDMENQDLPGDYDIVFCLEVLSHIRNKLALLRKFRQNAQKLILSANCKADGLHEGPTFGDTIHFCTVSQLKSDLQKAGWQILSSQDRRLYSLRTNLLWKDNLDRIYGQRTPPGQLGVLSRMVQAALANPAAWCQANPLIDIIAD